MKSLLSVSLAFGLLAVPAMAQVKDPGQESPLAARDSGQTSPLAKDPAKESPLAKKDGGQESPLAKPAQVNDSPLATTNPNDCPARKARRSHIEQSRLWEGVR